mmetsp:Transcript_19625/g.63745  ORF Transcript_19625/g.63745 Transcript_19625/m.63745 type:complete len:431 (-) Transcript_19625:1148-2440(-)
MPLWSPWSVCMRPERVSSASWRRARSGPTGLSPSFARSVLMSHHTAPSLSSTNAWTAWSVARSLALASVSASVSNPSAMMTAYSLTRIIPSCMLLWIEPLSDLWPSERTPTALRLGVFHCAARSVVESGRLAVASMTTSAPLACTPRMSSCSRQSARRSGAALVPETGETHPWKKRCDLGFWKMSARHESTAGRTAALPASSSASSVSTPSSARKRARERRSGRMHVHVAATVAAHGAALRLGSRKVYTASASCIACTPPTLRRTSRFSAHPSHSALSVAAASSRSPSGMCWSMKRRSSTGSASPAPNAPARVGVRITRIAAESCADSSPPGAKRSCVSFAKPTTQATTCSHVLGASGACSSARSSASPVSAATCSSCAWLRLHRISGAAPSSRCARSTASSPASYAAASAEGCAAASWHASVQLNRLSS